MGRRRFAGVVILFLVVSGLVWTLYRTNVGVVSPVRVVNERGVSGAALVVYYPGLSAFPGEVVNAFVEGLVSKGWRVDVTTASTQAPAALGAYRLLVLCTPVYWWAPATPVTRYVDRLGDVNGKPVVVLVTAAGQGDRAASIMKSRLEAANADILQTLTLYTMAPNDEAHYSASDNKAVALDRARQAAERLPVSSGR